MHVQFLGNHGGYSGAALWHLQDGVSGKQFCLRRWPVQSGQSARVRWIHRLLNQAVEQGFNHRLLPIPQKTSCGQTAFVQENVVYELTDWLPGAASFWEKPGVAKIRSVAVRLAEFHNAWRNCCREPDLQEKPLPGIQKRIAFIDELNQGLLMKIRFALDSDFENPDFPSEPFRGLANRALDCFDKLNPALRAQLGVCREKRYGQQMCIKDIWHDHVLFRDNQVSGIVDFGAIGIDNVATDVSRLFGSLLGNSGEDWDVALEHYQGVRELSNAERELIVVYDRSTTMLAGLNWLRWILIENRKFESYLPITQRMELLVNRLDEWI
ncbi:MAG: phosphotransferase [Planctomycetota bacterium]|nr:phosphotransferase [Planctomycetota bacterium]